MMKRIIAIGAILGSVVGGGLAIADAVITDAEPYKAKPMREAPKDPTIEQRRQYADEMHGRVEAFSGETGLTPLSGYQNERGETTGYVRTADLNSPTRTGPLDVVTLKGTKVGEFDSERGIRPDPVEVNRVAAEEAGK